jgi:hypothetical protein
MLCVATSLLAQGTHIIVCGDIHGQFKDLLHIWEMNGRPAADNPFLFNGKMPIQSPIRQMTMAHVVSAGSI